MFEIAFRDIQVSGKGVLRARSCYHTHLTAPPSLAAALCWYQQSRGLNNCRGPARCRKCCTGPQDIGSEAAFGTGR